MYKGKKILLLSSLLSIFVLDLAWALTQTQNPSKKSSPTAGATEVKERVLEIKEKIPYSYNFDADDVNFNPKEPLSIKGKTKRDYTILINVHDGSPVNLSAQYKRGFRTLSWGTPYEAALRQAMSAIHHAHDQSALLTSWTGRNFRRYVSFVVIPKDTLMEFKIGYAAPQSSSSPKMVVESRPGGGMQMRLKYLPEGAIILTQPLIESKKIEGKGTYALEGILKEAIEGYNKNSATKKLPEHIIYDDLTFVDDQEYVEHSFDIIN